MRLNIIHIIESLPPGLISRGGEEGGEDVPGFDGEGFGVCPGVVDDLAEFEEGDGC